MLIRLFGRNFRSFKNDFGLSMVAAEYSREEDLERGIFSVPIVGLDEPLRLLRAVGIYGPNASGKSSVLLAGRALNWLVSNSSQRMKPEDKIPTYEPFRLEDESSTSPVNLGCDVVCNEHVLRYEISYDSASILTEKLSLVAADGGENFLIDRPATGKVVGSIIDGSRVNRLYVTGMQPNVAVLSKLAQHGPIRGKSSVQPFYKAIQRSLRSADYSNSTDVHAVIMGHNHAGRFASDETYRKWIMNHLLKEADIGILDVHVRRDKISVHPKLKEVFEEAQGEEFPAEVLVVSFTHEGKNPHRMGFEDESAGTKKLYNIAGDWWSLAHEPGTLLADELSASLHPRLLHRLIQAVNEPPSNDVNSQLIFTTHDTGLLEGQDGSPPALRRDQVYFTQKDSDGASELYSLTEFKDDARPVHNIRKRYLSGLYNALPSVERLSL